MKTQRLRTITLTATFLGLLGIGCGEKPPKETPRSSGR